MMAGYVKPIRVTISDPDSGEVLESRVVENDYVLITAGNRYVKNIQVFGGHPARATHMVAIAVDKIPKASAP